MDDAGDREGAAGPLFYHGGNLAAARLAFPQVEGPWLDLSTGINPVPYPVGPIPADDWTRLPDADATSALCRAAAAAYGVGDVDAVVAAPGTQALLQWLPRLVAARRVGILGFTYAEHARCWAAAGAEVEVVPAWEDLANYDVAVVVNPNNPDGRLVRPADLLALADRLAAHGGLLVVDEAFMDVLAEPPSVAPNAGAGANVLVLRSFGKAYGLAGIRLGFAVAPPPLAAGLRTLLGPWAVSGPALTLGRRALADQPWLEATRARLLADRERLGSLLRQAGLTPAGGTPLYTLVELDDAHATFRRLARRGVLVRAFTGAPRWLRFGLPGPDDWARLAERLSGL